MMACVCRWNTSSMPFQAKPMRGVRRPNEHLPFRPITSVTWIPTFRADIFRVQSFPASSKKLSVFQEGVLMGQKLSALLIVIGGLLMALGLTLLAAGVAQSQDESIAGAGICAFAFGALR